MTTTKESWEKEYEKLDNNDIFKEFLDKYAPSGMVEVDDDTLQTVIAHLLTQARNEGIREVQEAVALCSDDGLEKVCNCHKSLADLKDRLLKEENTKI